MHNNEKLNILIVDDELELRQSIHSILETHLTKEGFSANFEQAEDGLEAVELAEKTSRDLIIMDVKMPRMSGIEALERIKSTSPQTFVVMMTAHGNLADAIQSIKVGAYDYLEKPLQPAQLIEIFGKALEARSLVSELTVTYPILDDDVDSSLVGSSEKMQEIFSLINKLCRVDTDVLIRGENGTGKELVARALHLNSPRKQGEFINVNCTTIAEELMESELFGHEKAAFPGANERKIGKIQLANNGTLFLDEFGALTLNMQVKLLRVLQEKSFTPLGSSRLIKTNARIIAATNKNLEKMIEDGLFREDLFFKLNVMPLFLPPLRERVEDIPTLTQQLITRLAAKYSTQINGVQDSALQRLKTYNWPGNIRELESVLEHAFVSETSNLIKEQSLPENIRCYTETEKKETTNEPLSFDLFKEKVEKEFIVNALKANSGRINKTVATANIPKNTLLRKIKKYQINVKDYQ